MHRAIENLNMKNNSFITNILNLNTQQKVSLIGVLCVIAACIFGWGFFGEELVEIAAEPQKFRDWLNQFGVFDEIIFILIRALQTVIKFIPAEPLEIASGFVWGAVPGMLYCVVGNIIGTVIILAMTKRLGRGFIEKLLPARNSKIEELFQASEKIYMMVFLLYLIPGSPKDGLTYLAGMLPIKVLPFLLISFVARIPSVLSSTLCGWALAEQQYMISALILVITLTLAIMGGVAYKTYQKRALKSTDAAQMHQPCA